MDSEHLHKQSVSIQTVFPLVRIVDGQDITDPSEKGFVIFQYPFVSFFQITRMTEPFTAQDIETIEDAFLLSRYRGVIGVVDTDEFIPKLLEQGYQECAPIFQPFLSDRVMRPRREQ